MNQNAHELADILVVDDTEDFLFLLEALLETEGYAVRRSTNGADALALVDQRFPQLVISDVEMPKLDGAAMILRMFIENLGRENIPVILISGHPGLAATAAAVGTPYFLSKPFDPPALLSLITEALREKIPPRPPLSAGPAREGK
jgi:two-component system C4-dicarboxylate transport response regulator DctD